MSAYTRRLVNETENIIRNDPKLLQDAQSASNQDDLARIIKPVVAEAAKEVEPWTGDKLLYRIAITTLSLLALIAALAAVFMTQGDETVPESLVALGSAAAGALVGLFAKPPSSSE